ncbi:hypothetical protein DdX_01879 [Ditylenchus destructor]|uniref:Uncharacterized protein n=1 Tax=Ditylenchus destructor TaxID=166010 RepID=A0AAD4NF42_9BILA|nr:hypothetical protein DdX_01879 [Ditylenchus destructor]
MKGADIDAIGTTFDITKDNNRKSLFEQIRKDAGKLDVLVIGQKPNQITGDIIQSTPAEIDEPKNITWQKRIDNSHVVHSRIRTVCRHWIVFCCPIRSSWPLQDFSAKLGE